jgi:ribonuclease P protein component
VLKPLASLKKQKDFKRVYKGRSAASSLFVVYAAEGDSDRLGLSVSKKIGTAVVRNRVKRLVRESCRILFAEKKTGQAFDLIVIARAPAGKLPREGSFAVVCGSLAQLFGRLGIF